MLLDEASARMVMSYRFLFIGLGQVMQQEGYSDREVQEVLERMEYLMPKELHDIDMTLKTDLVTSVYAEIGYTEGVKKYADELEAFYLCVASSEIVANIDVCNILSFRKPSFFSFPAPVAHELMLVS